VQGLFATTGQCGLVARLMSFAFRLLFGALRPLLRLGPIPPTHRRFGQSGVDFIVRLAFVMFIGDRDGRGLALRRSPREGLAQMRMPAARATMGVTRGQGWLEGSFIPLLVTLEDAKPSQPNLVNRGSAPRAALLSMPAHTPHLLGHRST